MAKLDRLPSLDIIKGYKGKLDFYVHMGQACVRSWPKKTTATSTDATRRSAATFGYVRSLTLCMTWWVQRLWESCSWPTSWTYMDYYTRCYYGATWLSPRWRGCVPWFRPVFPSNPNRFFLVLHAYLWFTSEGIWIVFFTDAEDLTLSVWRSRYSHVTSPMTRVERGKRISCGYFIYQLPHMEEISTEIGFFEWYPGTHSHATQIYSPVLGWLRGWDEHLWNCHIAERHDSTGWYPETLHAFSVGPFFKVHIAKPSLPPVGVGRAEPLQCLFVGPNDPDRPAPKQYDWSENEYPEPRCYSPPKGRPPWWEGLIPAPPWWP